MKALILALALLWPSYAHAVPCWMIRKAVAQYGEEAVEAWARSKGATEAQIALHRRCLK